MDEQVAETGEAQVTPDPDPVEEKLDRIVAQRLGKYAERTRTAETEAASLRERVAHLEGQAQATRQPQPQQRTYSNDELQKMVDAGQITPATMADQIAYQRQVQSEQRMVVHLQSQVRQQGAASEVDQYLQKLPKLHDRTSPEFQRVAQEAQQVADELGRPVTDPVVQRRALRTVYGSLDRLATAEGTRQFDRDRVSPAEYSTAKETQAVKDPVAKQDDDLLARVPEDWKTQWKQWGYSKARMLEEAKFIDWKRLKKKGIA